MALLADGDLTPSERRLCRHARDGQLLDLRSHRPGDDDPAKGRAWNAERQIRSQVLYQLLTGRGDLDKVFSPALAVRLAGAQVVGPLNLGGLTLRCPLALEACFLDDVKLAKTKAPDIGLRGSDLTGRLSAWRLQLDHDLDLVGLRCQGGVTLYGAHIGGILACAGATLSNDTGPALSGDRLTVDGGLYLNAAMVTGEIRLRGAHISGLDCAGATLTGRTPDGLALDLERASVDVGVGMTSTVLQGGINLTYARVGGWDDDEGSWPAWLRLEGFTYGNIDAPGVGVRRRLDWLSLQSAYTPQPYEQLAAVYRRAGDEGSARTVAIAKQRAHRASSRRWWVRWPNQA